MSTVTKESVLKEYDEILSLVKVHDYTLGNSTDLLERQISLMGDVQSLLNENQLSMDSLREIHHKANALSILIASKVRNEKKQKDDKRKEEETKPKPKASRKKTHGGKDTE